MGKVELELKVKYLIQQHSLIIPGQVVIVGVSGGADSVCLLHILAQWQDELGIELHIAHLNHQLRGAESEADARYVASLAGRFGIPVIVGRRDVAAYKAERGCSMEEAARELRYDFLTQVAIDTGASRVAVGHTRDDQVETVLMHILRGTGTSGLRGIEPCSPVPFCHSKLKAKAKELRLLVIRPLLDITRDETMKYCREHQLEPRIDSSNLSLSLFRNRIRMELLPLLRKYNPRIDETLLRMSGIAGDDACFVEQQAWQLWDRVARQKDNVIYLDKKKTSALPVALQRQLVRLAVDRVLGDTRDIEAIHIEAIKDLLIKPVGKRISLPHGLICFAEYDEILLALSPPSPCPFPPLQGESPLRVPGETILPGWRVIASVVERQTDSGQLEFFSPRHSKKTKRSKNLAQDNQLEESLGAGGRLHEALSAHLDLHRTGTELFVRRCQQGDRFQPLGMDMTKELKHFMVDARIPLSWRDYIPLVCSTEQILWVVGWRIDDRVKVTESTRTIIRLEFYRLL